MCGSGGGSVGKPDDNSVAKCPKVQDANEAETKAVLRAHERAKDMMDNAIANCLEKAKVKPCKAVGDYFDIKGTDAADQEKLDELIGNFKEMRREMDNASYEVEHETITPGKPYTVAYVYTLPLIHGVGDVHVCFPAFANASADEQAATLVHEMSHYAIGTDDNAYDWETTKWNAMSQKQKMDNADSYGEFARECSTSSDPCI